MRASWCVLCSVAGVYVCMCVFESAPLVCDCDTIWCVGGCCWLLRGGDDGVLEERQVVLVATKRKGSCRRDSFEQ